MCFRVPKHFCGSFSLFFLFCSLLFLFWVFNCVVFLFHKVFTLTIFCRRWPVVGSSKRKVYTFHEICIAIVERCNGNEWLFFLLFFFHLPKSANNILKWEYKRRKWDKRLNEKFHKPFRWQRDEKKERNKIEGNNRQENEKTLSVYGEKGKGRRAAKLNIQAHIQSIENYVEEIKANMVLLPENGRHTHTHTNTIWDGSKFTCHMDFILFFYFFFSSFMIIAIIICCYARATNV